MDFIDEGRKEDWRDMFRDELGKLCKQELLQQGVKLWDLEQNRLGYFLDRVDDQWEVWGRDEYLSGIYQK